MTWLSLKKKRCCVSFLKVAPNKIEGRKTPISHLTGRTGTRMRLTKKQRELNRPIHTEADQVMAAVLSYNIVWTSGQSGVAN